MTDRRRRLIKYNYKKEEKSHLFETQYPETIRRKEQVILKFSSTQLEELLNNSTKNVAQEVVTCLIPRRGEGVLVTLESLTNSEDSSASAQSKNKLMTKAHRSSASQVCYTSSDAHPGNTLPLKPTSGSHKKSDSTHLPLIN